MHIIILRGECYDTTIGYRAVSACDLRMWFVQCPVWFASRSANTFSLFASKEEEVLLSVSSASDNSSEKDADNCLFMWLR